MARVSGIYKNIELLKKKYIVASHSKEELVALLFNAEIGEQVYNSNAIENSTLTLDETEKILRQIDLDRYVTERELFEAKNLSKVTAYIQNKAKEKEFDDDTILLLHRMLMSNIRDEIAGRFRINDEYVRVGAYIAVAPSKIEAVIQNMLLEYQKQFADNVIERIAKMHLEFEHIYPFVDGNGRIGRVINNYLLIRDDLPPVF